MNIVKTTKLDLTYEEKEKIRFVSAFLEDLTDTMRTYHLDEIAFLTANEWDDLSCSLYQLLDEDLLEKKEEI